MNIEDLEKLGVIVEVCRRDLFDTGQIEFYVVVKGPKGELTMSAIKVDRSQDFHTPFNDDKINSACRTAAEILISQVTPRKPRPKASIRRH